MTQPDPSQITLANVLDPDWLKDNIDRVKNPDTFRVLVVRRWKQNLPECKETDVAVSLGMKILAIIQKKAWRQNPDEFRSLVQEALRNLRAARAIAQQQAAAQQTAMQATLARTPPSAATPPTSP